MVSALLRTWSTDSLSKIGLCTAFSVSPRVKPKTLFCDQIPFLAMVSILINPMQHFSVQAKDQIWAPSLDSKPCVLRLITSLPRSSVASF